MIFPKRTDLNQKKIVTALRKKLNCSVYVTHDQHNGFPDIVVGFKGKNFLFEIKKSEKCKLTKHQVVFHQKWTGQINTVISFEEILKIIEKNN